MVLFLLSFLQHDLHYKTQKREDFSPLSFSVCHLKMYNWEQQVKDQTRCKDMKKLDALEQLLCIQLKFEKEIKLVSEPGMKIVLKNSRI